MAEDYLHNHKDFSDLLNILADKNNLLPGLIEKDYWIMHVLYGFVKSGQTDPRFSLESDPFCSVQTDPLFSVQTAPLILMA
jgi:hypothetical protein